MIQLTTYADPLQARVRRQEAFDKCKETSPKLDRSRCSDQMPGDRFCSTDRDLLPSVRKDSTDRLSLHLVVELRPSAVGIDVVDLGG